MLAAAEEHLHRAPRPLKLLVLFWQRIAITQAPSPCDGSPQHNALQSPAGIPTPGPVRPRPGPRQHGTGVTGCSLRRRRVGTNTGRTQGQRRQPPAAARS